LRTFYDFIIINSLAYLISDVKIEEEA